MFTYSITIGRNVKNSNGDTCAMSEDLWSAFKEAAKEVMLQSFADESVDYSLNFEYGEGMGFWKGKAERNFKVTVLLDDMAHQQALLDLDHWLKDMCEEFDQDAIALTVGQSVLVERREED